MQLSAFLGALLSSGGSIIDLDGTMFVQLAMFFIAFFLLYVLVFKPMMGMLEAREEAIDGAKEQAKRLDVEVKEKQASFEAELRKVQSTSSEERDRLRAEGQEIERTLLERVRADTHAVVQEAKTRLEAEAARARHDLAAERPVLAKQIASKLLGREVQG